MRMENITYLATPCDHADGPAGGDWTFYSTGQALVLYGETVGVGGRVGNLYRTIWIARCK